MKRTYYIITAIVATALSLGSCVKDELFNTPHPDKGKIVVTTDKENAQTRVIDANGNSIDLGENPDYLFAPGTYSVLSYTLAEGITIKDTTATVAVATRSENAVIQNKPEIFFSLTQPLVVERDKVHTLHMQLKQQVRELTIVLAPAGENQERITGIEAYLTGVAGTMDLVANSHGTPADVKLPFTKITEGNHAGKWKAHVQLLGVTGTKQTLTGVVSFVEGNPMVTHFESDLTELLASFNAQKSSPLALQASMSTPDMHVEIITNVTNWQEVEGDDDYVAL